MAMSPPTQRIIPREGGRVRSPRSGGQHSRLRDRRMPVAAGRRPGRSSGAREGAQGHQEGDERQLHGQETHRVDRPSVTDDRAEIAQSERRDPCELAEGVGPGRTGKWQAGSGARSRAAWAGPSPRRLHRLVLDFWISPNRWTARVSSPRGARRCTFPEPAASAPHPHRVAASMTGWSDEHGRTTHSVLVAVAALAGLVVGVDWAVAKSLVTLCSRCCW